jgi:hypothetical protein
MIELLDAVRDRALLGATLPKLWPKQVELLKSLEDPTVSLHVWAMGRGSSKSTLCALAAIHEAALRTELQGMLARGRIPYVLVACPGSEQAREFLRLTAGMVEASPVLRPMAIVQADRIDFTLANGAHTCIRALPCRAESVRGMSASMIICDEFAHFGTTEGSSSARAMLEALDGSMVPFGDKGRTLLISTPKGTANPFAEKKRDIEGGVLTRAHAVQAPTWEVRPDLTQEFLDRKRLELGESSFRQELGAELVDAGGSFYTMSDFDFIGDVPAQPEDATRWTLSLDPAFHRDRFGVALVGPSAHEPRVLVVGALEGIEPLGKLKSLASRRGREDRTLKRVAQIAEPYATARPLNVVSDQHQGDAVKSYFGELGWPVKIISLTAPTQTAAFVSTRSRLVDGSLRCWRHPQLEKEMRRVIARDSESIVLPRVADSHCDLISALALGVWQFKGYTGVPEGRPSGGPKGSTIVGNIWDQSF